MTTDFSAYQQQIIDEFRATGGAVGGPFADSRLLLLTTTGARSSKQHTVPIGYLPDDGERLLVIASAMGAPRHPDWYHNLRAHPRVTVDTGVATFRANATPLEGGERDFAYARAVESDPGWAEYQQRTERVIPVVALDPVDGGLNGDSPSDSWLLIHRAFRRELALVRKEVAEAGPRLGAQLRINCLTLCNGLDHHHRMEDIGLFPAIDAKHPELAAAVDKLRAEHQAIKALVDELDALVSTGDGAPAQVLGEVDRLTTAVNAHLDVEEGHLLPILDDL